MDDKHQEDWESDQADRDVPRYRNPQVIGEDELLDALLGLTAFGSDRNLVTQAMNLATVDPFIMGLELEYHRHYYEGEATPQEERFLAAQSQMWIFSAYELLRTWIGKAKGYITAADNGGLAYKVERAGKDYGYENPTAQERSQEIQGLIDDPALVEKLKDDLNKIRFIFLRLETIRVALAKHHMPKREKVISSFLTFGMINRECGSLDYQMNNGMSIIGNISRRDIADDLRAIPILESQSDEEYESFKIFMRGITDEQSAEFFKDMKGEL